MGRRDFRKLAETLIKRYGTTNPFKIAKLQGIQVIQLDFNAWLGMYAEIKRVKTIYINNNLPNISKFMVCGHELGHGQQSFKEAVFMKEKYLFGTNKLENEANEFCATLFFNSEFDMEDFTEFDIKMSEELKKYLK